MRGGKNLTPKPRKKFSRKKWKRKKTDRVWVCGGTLQIKKRQNGKRISFIFVEVKNKRGKSRLQKNSTRGHSGLRKRGVIDPGIEKKHKVDRKLKNRGK